MSTQPNVLDKLAESGEGGARRGVAAGRRAPGLLPHHHAPFQWLLWFLSIRYVSTFVFTYKPSGPLKPLSAS